MKQALFHTSLVKAIQDDQKTNTRRLLKPQPTLDESGMWHWKDCQWMDGGLGFPASGIEDYAPYKRGDILYVRETAMIQSMKNFNKEVKLYFKADDALVPFVVSPEYYEKLSRYPNNKWLSPYYLTQETARIFLRVTNVRVERLQEITTAAIRKEGVDLTDLEPLGVITNVEYVQEFETLWNSTIKPAELTIKGWNANPWVWVIEFEKVTREEALKHG